MSVITYISKPANSICYHTLCEADAMGKALVAHITTKKNLADPFIKVQYCLHRFLVNPMLGMFSLVTRCCRNPLVRLRLMTGNWHRVSVELLQSVCRLPPGLPCCILPSLSGKRSQEFLGGRLIKYEGIEAVFYPMS
jgi:hypothetical protein